MTAVVVLSPAELRDLVASAVADALRRIDARPLPTAMGPHEVARRLGVAPSTIHRRIARGEIAAEHITYSAAGHALIATAWVLAQEHHS
ncbi:MAG: hypothetical protein RLZZ524_939 [Pseudomonadota bacterium]|jgi:hypothetical protein